MLSWMNQIHNHSHGTPASRKICVGEHEAISHSHFGVYRKRISDNCLILSRNNPATLRVLQWVPITLLVLCLLVGTGGGRANATMTTQEEKDLGGKVFLEVRKSTEILADPILQDFLDRVGSSLVAEIGPTPFQFKFYPVRTQDPNAYAIPGGYIFVTSGLLGLAENESEVAGVLAHEIAHVTSRHVADLMDRSKGLNLASMAAVIIGALLGKGGAGSQAVAATAMTASETLTLKYTREHEKEADQKGLHTLLKANYDPNAMVAFLNKLHKYGLTASEKVPDYLSTHPAIEDRIALLENLVRTEPKSVSPLRTTENYKWIQVRAFVHERNPDAAVSHFESLVKANPQETEVLVGLGLAYGKQGRYDKSVEVLQRAASLMPEASIRGELGVACFLAGKTDQAIEIFESLAAVSGSSAKSAGHLMDLYYLGRGYKERGDPARALPLLVKVERAMPEFIDVNLQLGSVYGRTGERGKSHYFFGRYFKLKGDRNNALLHFRTALSCLQTGSPEWEEAQREVKEFELPKKPSDGGKGPPQKDPGGGNGQGQRR